MSVLEEKKTVGKLVAEDYRKAVVFKRHGIDFCCGGNIALSKACLDNNIETEVILAALAELEQAVDFGHDFLKWEPDFLVEYIQNVHHTFVRKELPELTFYADKVLNAHGENHPELLEIRNIVVEIAEELSQHLEKEEQILFPFVKQMMAAKKSNASSQAMHCASIQNPIHVMELEHDAAGDAFKQIAKLILHSYSDDVFRLCTKLKDNQNLCREIQSALSA